MILRLDCRLPLGPYIRRGRAKLAVLSETMTQAERRGQNPVIALRSDGAFRHRVVQGLSVMKLAGHLKENRQVR